MLKFTCRLWNLSILSVLILTFSNILLTVRLLHSDCTKSNQHAPEEDKPGAKLKAVPSVHPSTQTTSKVPCKDSTHQNQTARLENARKDFLWVNPKLGRWDSRRMYRMFDDVVVGEKFPSLSEEFSVCLATQSSLEKLYPLVQVAHQWTGPISAALYAAGEEYNLIQWYVDFLRQCFPAVKERVSFHLAVPKDRQVSNNDPTDLPKKPPDKDCRRPEAILDELIRMRKPDTTKWRVKSAYPQNHLRNLARRNCQTEHVFLTDVDIIPSSHLAEGLDVFLKSVSCNGLCAYVIPTYELDERVRFPRNKSELVRLAKKGLARPFHQKVFIYNQFATNFSRWQATAGSESTAVHISHNVTNFEFLYEPFYVAPDTVPPHDERFIGYGYTRNTQVYEMYVAGYQFQVLSPIFTCHWGLQNKKSRPSWRERQNSMNRKHFDVFKAEVFARYRKDPLKMLGGKALPFGNNW